MSLISKILGLGKPKANAGAVIQQGHDFVEKLALVAHAELALVEAGRTAEAQDLATAEEVWLRALQQQFSLSAVSFGELLLGAVLNGGEINFAGRAEFNTMVDLADRYAGELGSRQALWGDDGPPPPPPPTTTKTMAQPSGAAASSSQEMVQPANVEPQANPGAAVQPPSPRQG